jgi:ABC-2 type transport system permease protein
MNTKRQWQALSSLTVASVKMYFRNVTALFFTMFIPVMLVLIFGLLNNGSGSKFDLVLTNYSHSDIARSFVDAVRKVDAFKVIDASEGEAMDKLGKGKVDLAVVIPESFGTFQDGKPVSSRLEARFNEGKPGSGQAAGLILGQIATGFNNSLTRAPEIVGVSLVGVKTNNLGVIDFLIPGIIAMSIMQLGIFSVSFGFISYKTSGALRRLQATPTRPLLFIIAQSIARIIVGVVQVALLLGLGVAVFHLHMVGSFLAFGVASGLGVIVFLAFGFCIAGWAKDENQAAPIANLVTFPMLFLSGVFFPRDGFPVLLKTVTNYFPLTFLADALRRIANEGASLSAVRGDLLGLGIWGVIVFTVAVLVFRWE